MSHKRFSVSHSFIQDLHGEGIHFSNGKCVICWYGDIISLVTYDCIDDVLKLKHNFSYIDIDV